MTVPNVGEAQVLAKLLNQAITLRLYSNNMTPAEGDVIGSYTEVAGGGYAAKSLSYANWSIVEGDPTSAEYAMQVFTFTGATNAPGTVYGYYITDADSKVIGAERFPEAVLPFTPAAGSVIRITPIIAVS
jgi:hypothetical protein